MAPGKENPWPGRVDQVLRMLPQDVAVASGTQLIGRFLRQPKGYSGPVAAAYTWESSEVIDTPLYENGRLTYLPEGLVDTQTSAKMTLLSRSDGPPPDPSRPLPQVEVLLWSRHADTVAEVQDTIAQLQEGIMGLEQGESHRGADRTMEMKQRLYGELHRLSILSVHRFSFDMQQAYVREKRQRQGEVVVNSSAAIIFQEYAGGA